ncbi:TadE family protein [Streptomyces sp. TLI_185]|uniref:TadE family protein n=1 Tax=Streptomyces sp. TLI_185 TaxID=2485151 RepID=UPI0021A2BBD7|nr:TadE family protein [Streptomyces sp. TLI_185]
MQVQVMGTALSMIPGVPGLQDQAVGIRNRGALDRPRGVKHVRSTARWARHLHGDEGSAAIEAAIVLPALIMFLCLAIAGGRIVSSPARRSILRLRTRPGRHPFTARRRPAQGAAQAAAAESLNDQGHQVRVDIRQHQQPVALSVPVGQVARSP